MDGPRRSEEALEVCKAEGDGFSLVAGPVVIEHNLVVHKIGVCLEFQSALSE